MASVPRGLKAAQSEFDSCRARSERADSASSNRLDPELGRIPRAGVLTLASPIGKEWLRFGRRFSARLYSCRPFPILPSSASPTSTRRDSL